jgi:hypothetical protein
MQEVSFYVIEKNGQSLLGNDKAMKLGFLHNGTSGNSDFVLVQQTTDTKAKLKAKYPECFDGLKKRKDFELKIKVDEKYKSSSTTFKASV